MRRSEQTGRLRLALAAMVAEQAHITISSAAERAGVSRNTVCRHTEHQQMVRAARQAVFERRKVAERTAVQTVPAVGVETGPAAAAGEATLAGLAAEWVDGRHARGEVVYGSRTVDLGRLSSLLTRCGHMAPAALDREMLLRWQATIGHLAPSTRRRYLGVVSMFCRWLVDEGHLEQDPSARLCRVREPRRVPRALDAAAVAAVPRCCPGPRELLMVWLMVGCGLRCIEVSRLDLADWSETDGTVEVVGKAGHERVLPVPQPVEAAIRAYLVMRGWQAGPLIMASGSKGQPDGRLSARWISKKVRGIMVDAGVHVPGDGRSAHALRHTCASDVYKRSRDIQLVQAMLGHASLQTTQVYLRRADLNEMRVAMAGRAYEAVGA